MSDYIITPEQATNGTFAIKSKAHTTFDGAVQQETTDNLYGKAISSAANSVGAWVTKDPSTATVDTDAMNALAQTDVTPQQSENFVNKASEILQPAMHRAEQIYLWNKADWAQSAIDSGEKLGISADLIMASGQEGIRRAEAAAAQIERGRTIQEVREMYPELEKVNYKNSAEAITTLQNLEAINNTRGVFDAVQQGVWSMNDQIKLGQVGWKLSQTTDKSEIEDLTKEMERLQSNLKQYRQTDGTDVLQQVVGATASQGYMMAAQAIMGSNRAAEGMALGAATGAVATAWAGGEGAIPGALTGLSTGVQVGMGEQMYQMSFGTKYIELINKRDAQGNRVYTDDEARKYAMSFAAVDAGIEFASFKVFGKALSSVAPKSTMAKAIQNATSDTAQTFSRGIGTTVAQMMKANVKAGGSELVEEGLQDINEKFQHNLYRNANDPEGVYSIGDMVVGAGGAMLQALPAVIGLGAIGGGISGIHTMKAFHEFQKLTPEEQQQAVMAEQNRNGTAIMQALKQDASSNKMAKENPELYGKIVQAQGDNVGVSTAYVNVNEMAETEQGQQAIKNMIDSGLVTQEEVSKSIEANADIPVPIGKYAQLSGGLTEETVKALEESTYFTRGGMSMKTLERAKAEVEAFNNNLVDATEKKAERVKESIIRDEFEDANDVDREVLDQVFSNPTQVKQAYNNLYKNLVQEYRENYASDFDNMDNDIKEATASGVEPQWLTDYKSNNGGKAPRTNAERRRAAYHSSVAKAQTAFADNVEALNQSNIHHADMEHTLQQIESLERLHDKIFALADNDIALRMQLSKSGYEVYNKVVKTIGESTNRKQRETAKANALLMAQHADVMAQYMRQMGRGGYTAMDYFRDSVRINMNAIFNSEDGYAQSVIMQQIMNNDIQAWSNVIDNHLNGQPITGSVKLMDSPMVLQLINAVGEIDINPSVIKKALNGKHVGQMDAEVLKQLPKKIANPIAIFKNYDPVTKQVIPNEYVVVLDAYANNKQGINASGENIQVVIKNTTVFNGRKKTWQANKIKTITPRRNANWYINQLNNGNLVYWNTKKINRLVTSNRQQIAQLGTKQFIFNNSIPNEKDLDKLRKKHNYQYYQSAWHGSPYDFDEFDLGSIGGGLGTQAFGWGLYFTENKNVAEKYKVERKSKNKFTLNGNDIPIEYAPVIEQIFGGINVENNKESLLNRLVLNRDAEQSNLDLVTKNLNELDGVLDFITQNSKFAINKLPTLVDNKFERMATVILNDAKTKAKSDNKRVNKEYLFDVIEELQKRYNKHYIFYNDIVSKISYLIDNIGGFEVTSVYKPTLYNVEIPDTDTMLDYSKPINEQSEYVLNKIKQLDPTDINKTGKEFYNDLSERLGGDKNASLKLNELGIKGIKYKHGLSHNFVVFDDKAINIIEKYNQSVNGMTEIMKDGERIISIFKTADRSTFLHEMGHVFFDDIQKLASMDNAPKQLLDDWNTLKEWSGWIDGENVDNTKAHEKFARGWESYLRSGEAPTKGLQRVFRQFSKWLTRIYRSVQRLGGEVPSDIKDIMARMIATQDDIENYAHEQALEQFENTKLYQQLSETEQARVQGYIADIKEKAKERVMRKYMKELDNRPIKEWEDVKYDVQVAIEKRLIEEYPIYKEHQRYMALGDGALENTQYRTIEGLEKAEREEAGSTYDEAVAQEMENARNEFVNDPNAGKSNQEIAEEMLLSNQGQMELTQEEARLIKAHTNKELAKNWELLSKLQKLDPNSENLNEELKPIEKELTNDVVKVSKELASTAKELDTAQDKIESLKAQLQERIDAVRAIRDGGFGTIPKYMERAKRELGDLTLSQASQYKKYQNQAVRDGKKADSALATGKVDEALQAKQSQMLNQARARVAFENQQRIKKLRTKLLEQNARITRAKNPVMLDPQLRYFYTHMMYQMGLIKRDGLMPTDGFDETVITNRLDPDAGIAGFNTLISMDDTVSGIFNAKSPRTFATLTVNELNMLEELMTGMYQNGRREYEHNSFLTENGNPLSIDYVERDILDKAIETFGEVEESTFNIENSKTTKNAIFNKVANFVESLQQIKTILRRLDGGKGGPAEMYIYDTINRARQHFNERLESETMRLAKNVALYSRKELYKIRNERGYQVGDARNLTKEQVMALALNWGTERNRQRAIETVKANEVEIERLFQDVLDDRDWEFIIREWEQINSFYPERSAVQERMTGNPLKKEEGITFRIGGRTIEGQYYPIMYDPKTSGKSSNHEMEDIAQSFMSSNATFGYGMSATKSRLDKVKDKQLLLSLDVIPRAITESINHIAMREAVTDVNTLINRKEFADYITNKLGASEYQYLRQWVRDQWTTEVSRLTEFDNMMQTIKRNISSAVMAGKVSVAIQNVANLPVAMEQLGAARVMRALYRAGVGVYGRGSGRYNETYEFVLGKSVMLRERVQTLDKDMRRGLEIGGKGFTIDGKSIGGYTMEQLGEARDAINSWGYSLLAETDLMLSVPIWKDVYDVEYSKLVQKEGISLEWADQRAIELADKAIIDIFGSGDIKDQAGIQRNKGTIANFATTFYTYAGTLWNMQLDGFYAFKDRGDFKKFARVIFYDLFMQAVIMVIYNNLFGSDDDDDPTKVAKSLTKEFVNQSVMGVPFVREGIAQAMNRMLGEKVYNRGTSPLSYAVIDKIDDIFTAVNSSKKDWTDVGRAGLQFANSMTGLSNTLTDGVMTIAKYGLTDIDAELEDLLYSVIFDKRLKSKKEKQKEKKSKINIDK